MPDPRESHPPIGFAKNLLGLIFPNEAAKSAA